MKGDHSTKINQGLLIMRIIIGALAMGCVVFACVAAGMHFGKGPPGNPPAAGPPAAAPREELPIVGYLGVGMLTFAVAARFIVPAVMPPPLEPPGSPFAGGDPAIEETMLVENLLRHYQTQLIILVAIAEGATFMLLVSLQAFDTLWTLPVAMVGILWILTYFPTYDGLVSYIDEQLLNRQLRKE